jgi:hypothetical protein
MQEANSIDLVSYCGLYCGACKRYLKGDCPGCKNNSKATWCGVRKCCLARNYNTCADCSDYNNYNDCKKLNNFFSKIFSLLFKSDRQAGINKIKQYGIKGFAEFMHQNKLQSIKKNRLAK